jgi:hypothetical protein
MIVLGFIAFGAAMHIVGGLLLLAVPQVALVTWTAGAWFMLERVVGVGSGAVLGYILIAAGIMALTGAFVFRRASDLLILPQYILYLASALGAFAGFVSGHYPDGYVPAGGGWFIMMDQLPAFAFAAGHTVELTPRFWRLWFG